jgi:hypothetical protein
MAVTYDLRCPEEGTITTVSEDPLLAKNTKCQDCGKPYMIRVTTDKFPARSESRFPAPAPSSSPSN